MEMIAGAGLVGVHLASGQPHVVPPGGTRPALGTNPLCFGFPSAHGPVIFDLKATPRQPGIAEIRIPSEHAFRERERRRVEGIVLERKVVEALKALASS